MLSRRVPVSWARGGGVRRWQLQALQVAQRGITYERWREEARLFLAKQKVLLRGAMVRRRAGPQIPYVADLSNKSWTLSNLFGHASFVCLALSYVSSDALLLRTFAVGGVSCNIVFQYYRAQPLWLPLKWNALFLTINGLMIAVLLGEAADEQRMSVEEKVIYDTVFKSRGMSPTAFLRLMKVAERQEVEKGKLIISSSKETSHLYLLQLGKMSVKDKSGKVVDLLHPWQFAGALSYLQYEALGSSRRRASREARKAYMEQSPDAPQPMSLSLGSSSWGEATVASSGSSGIENANGQAVVQGLANVVAEEPCVLLAFPFDAIAELIDGHQGTNISQALDRCLSADISKKMINRYG